MILVSSCLCGEKCKYNGGHNYNEAVVQWCGGKEILTVCPEVLGGLATPRTPAELQGKSAHAVLNGEGGIYTCEGQEVTAAFLKGAQVVLDLVKTNQIKTAILKANSPSCGKGFIYDGSFSGTLVSGNGITAQCLLDLGIDVFTEKEIEEKIINKIKG